MVHVSKDVFDALIAHAKGEAPNECCGLLAGKEGRLTAIYPIRNLPSDDPMVIDLKVPADRRFRYVMDPKEQLVAFKKMRQEGSELRGIYHSHPHSPAYPSATDVRLAFYSEVYYLIVSLEDKDRPQVRAFQIVEQKIIEEKIALFSST
jgi:proteasome lid subunit RPN8/RPN11